MFAKQTKNKKMKETLNVRSHLVKGTVVEGKIKTESDIRIDGTLLGTLVSSAKLVLGKEAKIKGDINCFTANIEGYVEGMVKTKGLLKLSNTAKIIGDIHTEKMVVEEGATIDGAIVMLPEGKKTINAEKKA